MSSSENHLQQKLTAFYDLSMDDLKDDEKYPIHLKLTEIEERYQTLDLLGKGGMKTVYKVFDQASERELALAKPNDEEDRDAHEDFLREALLNSSLLHPNIMPIYDIGLNEAEIPYFVMELKTEKNLKEKLQDSQKFNEKEALEIFLKICDGIAYAHANGILHLDLKPENIQVGQFGEVLICDWGCADYIKNHQGRQDDDHQHKSDLINLDLPTNLIMGTPGYIAPELYQSKKNLNVQSDIYALGVILYELCFHSSPPKDHQGQFDFNASQVSSSLRSICQKALNSNPNHRYANIEDLKRDLETHLSGHIPNAQQAHLGIVLYKFVKRNALLSTITMTASIIIAIISLVFIFSLNESKNKTEQALKDVIKEQSISKQLQHNLEETVVKEAFSFIWKGFYASYRPLDNEISQLLKKLQHVTAQNPKNYRAWKAKGLLYFMTQRFKEAVECHNIIGDNMDIFYKDLCIEYAKIQGDKRFLEIEDLAHLVEKNVRFKESRINYTFEKMLVYDYQMREEEDSQGLLLRAHLKLINPDWEVSHFDYNQENKSLEMGGKGLIYLFPPDERGSRKNVLQYYKVLRLFLQECDIDDFAQFKGLNLTRLDIQHTKLLKFSKEELPSLDQLISLTINETQLYNNPYLSELKRFRLIVKKNNEAKK